LASNEGFYEVNHPLRITTATAIDQSLITRITKAAMIAALHDEPEFSELFIEFVESEQSN
jgi:CRP/FNR family transcriptional regulator, cyclic AMP receptor protein